MHNWLRDGTEPPVSSIPSVGNDTLVPVARYAGAFPVIAGTVLPREANGLPRLDYGQSFADGGAIPPHPRATGGAYTVLVPLADAHGNDIAGIRPPMLTAPLGTYTGWNLRGPGHAPGRLFPFMGAYIPFPETDEQATLTGDTRPAILSRFPTAESYMDAIRAAAEQLLADGFIVEAGVAEFVSHAGRWGAVNHVHSL